MSMAFYGSVLNAAVSSLIEQCPRLGHTLVRSNYEEELEDEPTK